MALNRKLYITQDFVNGNLIRIDEVTGNYTAENTGGYGFPNLVESAVTQVRFMFSSYQKEENASTSLVCVSNVEYEVIGTGSNTVDVDNKEYVLGDIFVLMSDAVPIIGSGLSLVETGRFACVSTFLPSDLYETFAPSELGINALTFPDSAYEVGSEIYTTQYLAAASFPAGTYIVQGANGTVITVASTGFRYRVGEVFTTTGTTTFSNFSGTGTICLFYDNVTCAFPLYYEAFQARNEVAIALSQAPLNCNQSLTYKLFQIDNRLEAIRYNYEDVLNLDASGTQTLLNEILEIKTEQ